VAGVSSELTNESPALQMLFTTLMNAVDEAVRIDDLTEFEKQLRTFHADRKQDLKNWLAQDPEAVARLRGTVVVLDVNQATVEMFGAESVEQLLDYMNNTRVNVEGPDIAKFAAALLNGESGLTWTVLRHDINGQLMSGAMESRFIRFEDRVLACHVIRRKKTVRQLKVELSKMRQLHSLAVGATETGCWEVEISEGRMSIDATCHQLLGYDPGELPTTASKLIPMLYPDDRAVSVELAQQLHDGLSDEYRVRNRIRDKAGNWRWFLTHGRVIESQANGQAAHIVGTLRQIDVPRKTEELLRIERQAFAMQAARNPLRETLTHLCLRLEEVWPETRCSINLLDHAERRIRAAIAPSLPIDFSLKLADFDVNEVRSVCGDAIGSRNPVVVDDLLATACYAAMHENFQAWDVQRCWSVPALTPDNRLVATLCVFADAPGTTASEDIRLLTKFAQTLAILISQYQQDEQQQQLELRLQVQDKFQSLGKLAGGIAHDFNNLLTVISGHGEILQMMMADNPDAVEATGKILHAVKLATSLCRQMLTFAGRASVQVESVDMNEVAREVCSLLRPGLPDGITLQTRFSSVPAILNGDRGMLSQIVMNLASNAAEATSQPDGRIGVSVEVGGIAVPADELLLNSDVAGMDNLVCITVTDNGSGIRDEIRERMFDPFFTTRDSGKGLGLATVMGVIRRHGGTAHVTSEPGATIFRVYLPADAAPHFQTPEDKPLNLPSGGRRILLTDDDRAVRLSLVGMLEASGFQTEAFSCGGDLLEFSSEIHADDVILLDQNMPGLKGDETYELLRSRGIQNPVCFVTAYGTEPLQDLVDRDEACCIIEKPLQLSAFCDAFHRLTAQAHVG